MLYAFVIAGTLLLPASAPAPAPVTVINAGQPAIVRVTISPVQSVPSSVNQLNQTLYPGASQTILMPAPQQNVYDITAVYSDGHTITVPFWNISNVPVITIHPPR